MKAIVKTDTRPVRDQYFDRMWERFVRDARLTPIQTRMAHEYLIRIEKEQLRELLDIVTMASFITLIEDFGFGTTPGATRIPRFRNALNDLLEEAFGHQSISGDILYQYDGCAYERLRARLHRHGVEFDAYYDVPEEDREDRKR